MYLITIIKEYAGVCKSWILLFSTNSKHVFPVCDCKYQNVTACVTSLLYKNSISVNYVDLHFPNFLCVAMLSVSVILALTSPLFHDELKNIDAPKLCGLVYGVLSLAVAHLQPRGVALVQALKLLQVPFACSLERKHEGKIRIAQGPL